MTTQLLAPDPNALGLDNPWPGLDSFRERDRLFFRGREQEQAALLRLVLRERLCLIFGKSGLGKTSLLRAGVFPELRGHDVFPVYIRLDFTERHASLTQQVRTAITAACDSPEGHIEEPDSQAGDSLWEFYHRRGAAFWNERTHPVTPLLVFDQFEEVFTLGQLDALVEETQAFLEELAELVEGRAPEAVRARLEDSPEEAREYSFREHHYKVLISMREEWLPDLEALRLRMPSIVHNRLRLSPLNDEAALSVVAQAPHIVTDEVARKIVRFVASKDKRLGVEPALLSLMCRELNLKRLENNAERITAELLVGNADTILYDFYEKSVGDVPEAVRTFIEENLITGKGYRDSVSLDDAVDKQDVTEKAINKLVDRRLLRRETRDDIVRIELMHDRLTGVIKDSRDQRHAREEKAQAEAQALAAEREAAEARMRMEKARRMAFFMMVLTVLAVGAGGVAVWARSEAKKKEAEAIDANKVATTEAANARKAETAAKLAKDAAIKAQGEATTEAANARKAEAAAKLAKDAAIKAQGEATTEAANARKAETAAKLAKDAAIKAQGEATTEAANARKAEAAAKLAKDAAVVAAGEAIDARAELSKSADPLIVKDLIDWAQVWPRGRDKKEALDYYPIWEEKAAGVLLRMPELEKVASGLDAGRVKTGLEEMFAMRAQLEALRAEMPNRKMIIENHFALWGDLPPQDGLVPIPPADEFAPREFWHTASGEIPQTVDGIPTVGSGLVLVLLPGGTFRMGSSERAEEGPVHKVALTRFLISKYEVTRAQWKRLTRSEYSGDGRLPKVSISWDDCTKELLAWDLTLPSEAQWEYACRAGTTTPFWSKEVEGWHNRNSSAAKLIGMSKANPFGLHDMHGNIWEWCLDGWVPDFYDKPEASEPNPVAPHEDALERIARGGSFEYQADYARSAFRVGDFRSSKRYRDTGVRPARAIQE